MTTAREQYAEVLAAHATVSVSCTLDGRGYRCTCGEDVADFRGYGVTAVVGERERAAWVAHVADALAAALPDPEQAEAFVRMREAFKREHRWRREAEARTEQAVRGPDLGDDPDGDLDEQVAIAEFWAAKRAAEQQQQTRPVVVFTDDHEECAKATEQAVREALDGLIETFENAVDMALEPPCDLGSRVRAGVYRNAAAVVREARP